MGIERFFNSLVKNNTVKKDGGILVLEKKIEADYVYIDFNSIIYNISMKIEEQLNKLLYEIIINSVSDDSKAVADKYGLTILTLEEFVKYFKEDYVDRLILHLITEQIDFIVEELINGDNIKTIYIAMDGVPNMAKIIEQKKRRYIGYITSKLKKHIYDKHVNDLGEKRKLYETHRYSFNRNKILAWHEFMRNVSIMLTSEEFVAKIKNRFKHLNRYVFSGADVPGEGEKKIMEDIIAKNIKGKFVVYSPDADVIILSMIMLNQTSPKNEFYVMRFDQNTREYSIVDINKLCDNIFSFINSNLTIDIKLHKTNVVNDIAFLFTMFGNDFVHKIESIDVRNDFEVLLHIYAELMSDSKKSPFYITKHINGVYEIDFVSLSVFLYKLKFDEELLLIDTYMSSNYKNYRFIKDTLEVRNLHVGLQEYIKKANNTFSTLFQWAKDMTNKGIIDRNNIRAYIDNNYNRLLTDIITVDKRININDKYVNLKRAPVAKTFIKGFLILEKNNNDKYDQKNIQEDQLYHLFKNKILGYFKTINNKVVVDSPLRLKFKDFETSVNTKFHENRIAENMVSEKMEITAYDKEVYSMDNMMDDYRFKLNAVSDDVGKAVLTVKNDRYVYKSVDYNTSNKRYYEAYFNKTDKMDICKAYIAGICWVFDFYFNKNVSALNYENVSTWFYKYHKAPLLADLSEYMNNITDKKELNNLKESVLEAVVKRNDFLNTTEHYLYIMPKNGLNVDKLHDSINEIVNVNSRLFPDMNPIIDTIINAKHDGDKYNPKILVDCRRAAYLTKCNVDLEDVTFKEFIDVFKSTRDKYKDVTILRNEPNVFTMKQQTGGSKNSLIDNNDSDLKFLHEVRHLYKEKYVNTNYKLYKVIYKLAKHGIKNHI